MGTHCHCERDSCGGIRSEIREHVETERIRKPMVYKENKSYMRTKIRITKRQGSKNNKENVQERNKTERMRRVEDIEGKTR